jgi:uncharacterized paraquat-inducible protein A
VFIITLTAFCVAFSHFSKVKPGNGNFAKMAFGAVVYLTVVEPASTV